MINLDIIRIGLKIVMNKPGLIEEMGLLPNMNLPTLGGKMFWNDLVVEDGWRVQRNSITGHCRILDDKNVRRAWGGEKAVMEFFEKIAKNK